MNNKIIHISASDYYYFLSLAKLDGCSPQKFFERDEYYGGKVLAYYKSPFFYEFDYFLYNGIVYMNKDNTNG